MILNPICMHRLTLCDTSWTMKCGRCYIYHMHRVEPVHGVKQQQQQRGGGGDGGGVVSDPARWQWSFSCCAELRLLQQLRRTSN